PGNTERYRTFKQLEYDRDIRFPVQLEMLKNRIEILQKEYNKNPNIDLLNNIFGLSNSTKAFTGILKGLNNPNLIGRKKMMEDEIRSKTKLKGEDPWAELEKAVQALRKYGASVTLLGPSPIKGDAVNLIFTLAKYEKALGMPDQAGNLTKIREEIKGLSTKLNTEQELDYLSIYLAELKKFEHPENQYIDQILDGKTAEKRAQKMIEKTDFTDSEKLEKIFMKDAEKFKKFSDPLLDAARILSPKYNEAIAAFQSSTPKRRALEAKIANAVFNVKGSNLPPDATFTLRLADGVVKGYDYNGTTAPYKTSFYGLYDRYYSNDKKFPWALPEKWLNPPMELLQAPMCYVSTNDIIGGNSGSPMINKNKEAVGLIFDGNIESLPGNFIYDEVSNRTVSVHAGGILAALKYIYKADRIVNELGGM
ncbi:MAG: S46 family peptidase, partial [Saprospiraceae bacterium]